MIKQLTFILLFSIITKVTTQENRIIISGKLYTEGTSLENIHISNKNSGKGTISNAYGQFSIPVKINDTIVISGIQFYKKEILITYQLIKNKLITIELFQKINELDEVELKAHNLTGSLSTDANNIKSPVSKVDKGALDFSMIDFKKTVIQDIDEIDRRKPPDITHLVSPMGPGVKVGIGLKKLLTKEDKKLNLLKNESRIIGEIRIFISAKYFIDSLKIPLEEIDYFLEYCKSKGIVELYRQNRKIEVINLLINQSSEYKKFKKID